MKNIDKNNIGYRKTEFTLTVYKCKGSCRRIKIESGLSLFNSKNYTGDLYLIKILYLEYSSFSSKFLQIRCITHSHMSLNEQYETLMTHKFMSLDAN